jgi:hypothetical protein
MRGLVLSYVHTETQHRHHFLAANFQDSLVPEVSMLHTSLNQGQSVRIAERWLWKLCRVGSASELSKVVVLFACRPVRVKRRVDRR